MIQKGLTKRKKEINVNLVFVQNLRMSCTIERRCMQYKRACLFPWLATNLVTLCMQWYFIPVVCYSTLLFVQLHINSSSRQIYVVHLFLNNTTQQRYYCIAYHVYHHQYTQGQYAMQLMSYYLLQQNRLVSSDVGLSIQF